MRSLPLCLVLAFAAGARAAPPAIDDATFADLTEKLADSPGFKVRLQAAMVLGRTGGDRAFDPLVRALEADPHFTVRGAAALALGNLGDPRAIEPLVRRVDTDPDGFVSAQAVSALAQLSTQGAVQAVPYLVAARDRADAPGRHAVVRALAAMTDAAALRALAESLADADSDIRGLAEGALGKASATAAGDALIACLAHSNYKVRAAAAQSLAHAREGRAVDALAELVVDPIEVPEVQLAAREALVALKDRLDVHRLVRSSRESPDKRERARALALLGAVGGDDAFEAAMAGLKDRDVYVRGIAASVIGTLDDPRAVPALQKLLDDAQENARIVGLVKGSISRLNRKAAQPPAPAKP